MRTTNKKIKWNMHLLNMVFALACSLTHFIEYFKILQTIRVIHAHLYNIFIYSSKNVDHRVKTMALHIIP